MKPYGIIALNVTLFPKDNESLDGLNLYEFHTYVRLACLKKVI